MAARLSPKKLPRYSLEFKRGAVKLTQVPGMEVQVVAKALDIHPVMLSRWRQEAREGRLRGTVPRAPTPKVRIRELKRLQELERAYALLQEEHELLKKAIRFSSARRPKSSRFIEDERRSFKVKRLCALYGVTRSGFYAWRARGESRRRQQDRALLAEVGATFAQSGGTYGSPRIHRALAARGVAVSRRRVERLMRTHGLRARAVRLYRPNPGLHRMYERNPNLLWKHRARRPDRVWVSDVTYLAVAGKWHYLAVVMDQCSRRVLGWSLGRVRNGRLTRRAFDLAVCRRRPRRGLILHSDRGSEYAGTTLRRRLNNLGVRQSMTRGGCPGDNAHAESFFHSMKAEVIHGARFTDDSQLRTCIRAYVRFYNHERLHSSLGYRSPVEYERRVA